MVGRSSLPGLPSPPVDLVAVAVGARQVILAWTDCGARGLGFRIERADGIGSAFTFSEIGWTGPDVAAFGDGSVTPGTSYTYRVRARNASGDSPPSEAVKVTTPDDMGVPAEQD